MRLRGRVRQRLKIKVEVKAQGEGESGVTSGMNLKLNSENKFEGERFRARYDRSWRSVISVYSSNGW